MREKELAAQYGDVSRDTARRAREAVSELVEKSILDK
jgi:DNA-binding GntR family transcriptional regulator